MKDGAIKLVDDAYITVDPDRQVEGDHGLTICAYVGEHKALQFDCFENRPHYHYFPLNNPGGNEQHFIDKVLTGGDTVEYIFRMIEDHLGEMLKHCGYPEVAEAIAHDIDTIWFSVLDGIRDQINFPVTAAN